ncbi:hypothetical protein GCM10011351_29700 [Paraliobacillus quinghaiensis]|uniref:Uncharacterized protein n=1 Tax=Paraliobacillus quinghaiensis TaxID=470815 RepID=A0A917TWW7_9BACI|nr:hypothetical protein GCM10011351_29700 [Paraliobacillus quinghaiensis]
MIKLSTTYQRYRMINSSLMMAFKHRTAPSTTEGLFGITFKVICYIFLYLKKRNIIKRTQFY